MLGELFSCICSSSHTQHNLIVGAIVLVKHIIYTNTVIPNEESFSNSFMLVKVKVCPSMHARMFCRCSEVLSSFSGTNSGGFLIAAAYTNFIVFSSSGVLRVHSCHVKNYTNQQSHSNE